MENVKLTSREARPTSARKADASILIAEFFQATDLGRMRVELRQLLKVVTTNKPFLFLGDSSTVLYPKEYLHQNIRACWLLLDVAEGSGEDLSVDNCHSFVVTLT